MRPLQNGELNRSILAPVRHSDRVERDSRDSVRQSSVEADHRRRQRIDVGTAVSDAGGRTRASTTAGAHAAEEVRVQEHRVRAEATVSVAAAAGVDRGPAVAELGRRIGAVLTVLDGLQERVNALGDEMTEFAAAETQKARAFVEDTADWTQRQLESRVESVLERSQRAIGEVEAAAGRLGEEAGKRVQALRTLVEHEGPSTGRWAMEEIDRTTTWLYAEATKARDHLDRWSQWADASVRNVERSAGSEADRAAATVEAELERIAAAATEATDPEPLRDRASAVADQARTEASATFEEIRRRTSPPRDPGHTGPGSKEPSDPSPPAGGDPSPPSDPNPPTGGPKDPPHVPPPSGGRPDPSPPLGGPATEPTGPGSSAPETAPRDPDASEPGAPAWLRRIRLRLYSLNELVLSAHTRLAEATDKIGFLATELNRIANEPFVQVEEVQQPDGAPGGVEVVAELATDVRGSSVELSAGVAASGNGVRAHGGAGVDLRA